MLSLLLCISFLIALWTSVTAVCPNWCNQRGICTAPHEGGYCYCDYGFAGDDCSQRLCPAGFDPLTYLNNPNRRTVRLETGTLGGIFMGKIEFSFGGATVAMDADAAALTSQACTDSLSALKSVTGISCEREYFNPETKTGTYKISLLSFPQKPPYMNNIIFHDGNPSLDLFRCNVSRVDEEEAIGPFCNINDVTVTGQIPVYAECSNHGTCARIGGLCSCEPGFKGPACDDISDNQDINATRHEGPFFTASLMKLHVIRSESIEFNVLQTQINYENVTTLRGDRSLLHRGDVEVTGTSHFISPQATQEDLLLADVEGSEPHAIQANIKSSIEGKMPLNTHHLYAESDGVGVFQVDKQGKGQFAGGLTVTDMTTGQDSFAVQADGQAIATSLTLKHHLEVQGSVTIDESLTIGSGFALTPGGMTVDVARHTGTLLDLRSRESGFNGTLFELHSAGDTGSMIRTISEGKVTFELTSGGEVKMQGLHLTSGGIQVDAGGLSVGAGGLRVKGGIVLESGELVIDHQHFVVGSIHAETRAKPNTNNQPVAANKNLIEPLFSGSVVHEQYLGNLLHLTAMSSSLHEEGFNFIALDQNHTSSKEKKRVFSVASNGKLTTSGGALFTPGSNVEVQSALKLRGDVEFRPMRLSADATQPTVVVVNNMNYVILADNVNIPQIKLIFATEGVAEGRMVIVSNQHHAVTTGDLQIPPQSTVIVVFDGHQWMDIQALKAPMRHLQHVESLEAVADLHIGNVTVSAQRLQATGLTKGSLVIIGKDGLLIENEKLQFVKGNTLAVPNLKVERIVSNVDMRGNDITNALLSNARLTGANINAVELSIVGQAAGLAYFNAKGKLTSTTGVRIDPDTEKLLITELNGPLNGNQHELSHIHLKDAKLSSIEEAKIAHLFLTPSSNSKLVSGKAALLMQDSQSGEVKALQGGVYYIDEASNILHLGKVHIEQIQSNVDLNGKELRNAQVKGGSIADVTSIRTQSIGIDSLAIASGSSSSTAGVRLVYTDANGVLNALPDPQAPIHIPNIAVDSLTFSSASASGASTGAKEIDFAGRLLRNAQLSSDIDLGLRSHLHAKQLQVDALASGSLDEQFLITSTSDGHLKQISGFGVKEQSIEFGNRVLHGNDAVFERKVKLPFLTGDSALLGFDDMTKEIKAMQDAKLSKLTSQDVAIEKQLKLPYLISSLLAVDGQGNVIALSSGGNAEVDGSFRHMVLQSASVQQELVAQSIDVEKLKFGERKRRGASESNDKKRSATGMDDLDGNILIVNKDGSVTTSKRVDLDVDESALYVSHVRPIRGTDSLTLHHATVQQGELQQVTITSSPSISTQTLTATDFVDLRSDVSIGGSVTVHGSVVGSGPYVDSSDIRVKQNITKIEHALEMVMQMNAVRYQYNTEKYPERNFPQATQIGFIAQEVEPIAPELVFTSTSTLEGSSKEEDAMKAIAYGHTCALLVPALQELKQQHDVELASMRNEIDELKAMLQQVLQKQQQK